MYGGEGGNVIKRHFLEKCTLSNSIHDCRAEMQILYLHSNLDQRVIHISKYAPRDGSVGDFFPFFLLLCYSLK